MTILLGIVCGALLPFTITNFLCVGIGMLACYAGVEKYFATIEDNNA